MVHREPLYRMCLLPQPRVLPSESSYRDDVVLTYLSNGEPLSDTSVNGCLDTLSGCGHVIPLGGSTASFIVDSLESIHLCALQKISRRLLDFGCRNAKRCII
jgi:hypothetical protein